MSQFKKILEALSTENKGFGIPMQPNKRSEPPNYRMAHRCADCGEWNDLKKECYKYNAGGDDEAVCDDWRDNI